MQSPASGLNLFGDLLHVAPDAQQIAAPDLGDLLLGVAAAHQFERDVERVGRAVPAVDAAAAVEVRRDADVIDPDELHGVVDVIDVVLHGRTPCGGPLPIDLRHPAVEVRPTIGGQRLGPGGPSSTAPAAACV